MALFKEDTFVLVAYPQILLYFIFNLYLSIQKNSSVLREWLKSLNFGGFF